MNRHLAFLPALALLLCGCDKADDDTTLQDSITFDVETLPGTRGSVIGGNTLPTTESFRVYAWETVGSETTAMMTRDAGNAESNVVSNASGYWAPQKRYYWPTDEGATVSFYAVYPKDHAVTRTADDLTIDFTVPADVSSQYDMMAAKTEGIALAGTQDGAVPLAFSHLTSQVSFRARLATAFEGWQVDVRSIRVCNVNSRGTYSYGSATVTPANPAVMRNYDLIMAATSVTVASTSEAVSLTSAADVAMLLPQTLTAWDRTTETSSSGAPSTTGCYLAIGCTITDSDGNRAYSGNTYVPLSAEWQAACHYNYLLEFGTGYQGDGQFSVNNIALTVAIAEWATGNSGSAEAVLD